MRKKDYCWHRLRLTLDKCNLSLPPVRVEFTLVDQFNTGRQGRKCAHVVFKQISGGGRECVSSERRQQRSQHEENAHFSSSQPHPSKNMRWGDRKKLPPASTPPYLPLKHNFRSPDTFSVCIPTNPPVHRQFNQENGILIHRLYKMYSPYNLDRY